MFKKSIKKLFRNEGFYTNNPADPGGKTILGITKRDYPEDYERVIVHYRDGDLDGARSEAAKFYKKNFWYKNYDSLDDPLADTLFLISVNMGAGTVHKQLQKVLNYYFSYQLEIDGIFGSKTLFACVAENQRSVRSALIYELSKRYYKLTVENPENNRFLLGWLNRLYS